MDKEEYSEITWICKKCGLLRSNQITHIHGITLPDDKLKQLKEIEDAKIKHSDASI